MKKTKEIIPVIYDFMLYEILTDVNLKEFLSYIISSILMLDYEYVLKNIIISSNRHRIINKKSKRVISDIIIKIGNNIINIEGNKDYYDGVLEKSHYYFCKLIGNSLNLKESYKMIPNIYQINFNNFKVNKSVKEINEYLMMEKDSHDVELYNFKKFHINLDIINKKCYNNYKLTNLTKIEKYLLIMITDNKEILKELAKEDNILKKVANRIMEINENYDEWIRVYDCVEEQKRICNTMILNAEEKVQEANEKVQEANEKVQEANEKVQEANEKVQKANEKVQKANEKIQVAEEKVQKAEEKIKVAKEEEKRAKTKEIKAKIRIKEISKKLKEANYKIRIANESQKNTALKMLKKGLDFSLISECTGLNIKEIKNLKMNI